MTKEEMQATREMGVEYLAAQWDFPHADWPWEIQPGRQFLHL